MLAPNWAKLGHIGSKLDQNSHKLDPVWSKVAPSGAQVGLGAQLEPSCAQVGAKLEGIEKTFVSPMVYISF